MTVQSWTRATTIAGTLADRFGLEQWGNRNVVLGIAARPDLYALSTTYTADDKKELGKLVKQAQEAAKAHSGANLGKALHRLTEKIDRGEILDVVAEWRGDIDAYVQTLADHGVRILPEWIERVVIAPQYQAAGTLDRLVYFDGRFMIADLKTGQDALDGDGDIAVQLAVYANATHAWLGDPEQVPRDQWKRYSLPHPDEAPDMTYELLPEIDLEKALVIHLPVGQAECTLYEIDIKAGAEAIDLALAVREWRKRKDLSSPLSQWKEVATVTDIRDAVTAIAPASTANYDW